jgi:hypothetical protein
MYRCGVGLGPLKAVQGRESTSLCHGQISAVDYVLSRVESGNIRGPPNNQVSH